MKVKAAAKINLALDVTGKLPNGYHTIESVFQTVGLYDEITVELTEKDIVLSCEVPEKFAESDEIPCDERNIAYKTARKFFEENKDFFVGAKIQKVQQPSRSELIFSIRNNGESKKFYINFIFFVNSFSVIDFINCLAEPTGVIYKSFSDSIRRKC